MLIKALYDLTAGQMMRRHLFCLSVFGFWNDPFPENGNYNCVQGGETSAENESFCCEQGQDSSASRKNEISFTCCFS